MSQPEEFVQALIAEYTPGTPLGWHRDVPDFELIVGISLGGNARIRFRPYPWKPERRKEVFALELEPRSAYILRDDGALGLAAQHSADEGAALLGHVPHGAPEPELRGAGRVEAP